MSDLAAIRKVVGISKRWIRMQGTKNAGKELDQKKKNDPRCLPNTHSSGICDLRAQKKPF